MNERIRNEIVHYFRKLYEERTINLFEGNVSARVGDTVLITPSQMNKETLTAEDIVEMDCDGRPLPAEGPEARPKPASGGEPRLRPSSEARMHLEIYRLRPDLRAVVHTHSAYATAFAVAGMPIRTEHAELYRFFGGEIPCCAYGTPGTDAVFADFERYFVRGDKDCVLLANHGLVTAGRTPEEAFSKAEAVEKLARIALLGRILGTGNAIPFPEREELLRQYAARRTPLTDERTKR